MLWNHAKVLSRHLSNLQVLYSRSLCHCCASHCLQIRTLPVAVKVVLGRSFLSRATRPHHVTYTYSVLAPAERLFAIFSNFCQSHLWQFALEIIYYFLMLPIYLSTFILNVVILSTLLVSITSTVIGLCLKFSVKLRILSNHQDKEHVLVLALPQGAV